jgi:hypothetical protein
VLAEPLAEAQEGQAQSAEAFHVAAVVFAASRAHRAVPGAALEARLARAVGASRGGRPDGGEDFAGEAALESRELGRVGPLQDLGAREGVEREDDVAGDDLDGKEDAVEGEGAVAQADGPADAEAGLAPRDGP